MIKYISINFVYSVLVLIGVLIISFILLFIAPGDPVKTILGERADSTTIVKVKSELGLDKPVYIQFFIFLKNVISGDFGKSYSTNRQVFATIVEKIPATALLAISAILIASFLGILTGIISATKQNTYLDRFMMFFSLTGISIPQFALGLIFILIFGYFFKIFPISGYISDGGIEYLFLPAFTLALRPLAIISRITRTSMMEVINSDYIRTAKSKGLSKLYIIFRHALRNSLNPVITTLSSVLAATLGGAFFIEYIFNWHGIGQLAIESVIKLDYPMIQGTVMFTAIVFIVINFFTDILYALLDPKIRFMNG